MDQESQPMDPSGAAHVNHRACLRTTRWSLVQRATTGGSALNEWAAACWYPLYAWARSRQYPPEESADAVQEFLFKLCSDGRLGQADPTRGRFRSWLLTGFSNHLAGRIRDSRRLKRGAGAVHLSINLPEVEAMFRQDMESMDDPGRAYTRAWALSLMDEALERLENHYQSSGRHALYSALLPALEGPVPDATFGDLATRLGIGAPALRQAAVRFRQRYRKLLLEVAGERLGLTCEVRIAEEIRELLGQA